MKAVYIKPNSGMSWLPPSDTLYGLIFTAMGVMGKHYDLNKIIDDFVGGNPPFILSSAFPFSVGKDGTRKAFLPFPASLKAKGAGGKAKNSQEYRKLKEFRKLKYIGEEDFGALCNGEMSPLEYRKSGRWKNETPPEMRNSEVMHNSINRMSGMVVKGALFDHREIRFGKGGVYFLVRGESDLLKGALNYLSDFGIGGNNSIGLGQFSWEMEDFSIPESKEGNSFVSLSRYLPGEDEASQIADSDLSYYSLETVRGTLGTHFTGNKRLWKKRVTVLSPGSVVPHGGKQLYGRMAEVKDRSEGVGHPVYFTGYAFDFRIVGDNHE